MVLHITKMVFGSPIGKLKGINLQIEDMSPRDLKAYGIYEGEFIKLEFESGVKIQGKAITGTRDLSGKILLISFTDCTVTYQDQVLFDPSWGIYDMAIGKEVISAYSGAADYSSFEDASKVSETKTKKITYTVKEEKLYALYAQIRKIRAANTSNQKVIKSIFVTLVNEHPSDWLLALEIYELSVENAYDFSDDIYQYLLKLQENTSFQKLIENGLQLIKTKNY